MPILTQSGRVAIAESLALRPLHLAWGSGDGAWVTPPAEDSGAALLALKAAYLYLVWQTPPTSPVEQWVTLCAYAAVAVNNLRVLRVLRKLR